MTTPEENVVLDHLAEAWNTFVKLQRMHPDELDEFRGAIHQAQYILAVRVARRADPATWPTYDV